MAPLLKDPGATTSLRPPNRNSARPDDRFHTTIALSLPPEASHLPSGLNASASTGALCPTRRIPSGLRASAGKGSLGGTCVALICAGASITCACAGPGGGTGGFACLRNCRAMHAARYVRGQEDQSKDFISDHG